MSDVYQSSRPVRDAFDEFAERILLGFELVVETLGDFVAIERIAQPLDYAGDIERFFFGDGKGDRGELLQQKFVRLPFFPDQLAVTDRLAGKARCPKPNLFRLRRIRKDEHMLSGERRNRLFNCLSLV